MAQEVEPPRLPRGGPPGPPITSEIVIEPAPSFSNIKLNLSRFRTRSDIDSGINIGETIDLQLLQPFKSSPYGAHAAEQGLGSVRSAELKLSMWRTRLMRPDEPLEQRAHPVTAIQLLGAVGHRRFDAPLPETGRVDRMPFALGAMIEHRPGDPGSFLGRQKLGLGLQYRRQYLPAAGAKTPVRVGGTVVHGLIEGAIGKVPMLANGLSYRLAAGYDLTRKIPGAELSLTTAVYEDPRILLGIGVWVQGRDEDVRTRDKRFDFAPRISIQF